MAFGLIILGHAFDEVDQKVIEEIKMIVTQDRRANLEVAVAEMIVEMAPAVEMACLACSGTEADDVRGIRVARGTRGDILKFEWNYHGMHDHGCGQRMRFPWKRTAMRESDSVRLSGIPKSMREFIITLPSQTLKVLSA
ncbi:MAG: hypothetical protein U0X87_07860 [Anaerolineales bacterium]